MVEDLTIADYRRTLELLRRYESARLGFVDATVMAVAERLNTAYSDNGSRRFLDGRPEHCKVFELLP